MPPSTSEPRSLSEAFPEYPGDHPQNLADLVAADPEKIKHPVAWFLRRQALAAVRSSEKHEVRGPKSVLSLLSNGYALHPWDGSWVAYLLNGDRQVHLVPDGKGGLRSLRKATRLLPKADDLPAIPASAHHGEKDPVWLIIYGGSPEVLSKEHVATGLATLQRRAPIGDICFYVSDPDAGVAPTLWSVRAKFGVTAAGGPKGTVVEFPDPDKLTEVSQ